jgi:hypothetical protein
MEKWKLERSHLKLDWMIKASETKNIVHSVLIVNFIIRMEERCN